MRRRITQQIRVTEGENIAEIDRLVAQNEAVLEGIDDANLNSPEAQKRQKSKASREEIQAKIIKGFENIANVIMKSTEDLVKSNLRLPIPENKIWDHVVELNLNPINKMLAYLFLIKNPDMLGALLGCSLEERTELIMSMLAN
jgi:hypothetical protein